MGHSSLGSDAGGAPRPGGTRPYSPVEWHLAAGDWLDLTIEERGLPAEGE